MSSGEIHIVATFYPKPGKADELIAIGKECAEKVHATEPDTLIYYALKVQDKDEVIFVEKYKNQATVDAHLKTEHFQQLAAKVPDLTTKPFDIKIGSFLFGYEGRSKM
ncbi:hypothetical protein DTO166G4_7665 [Paecilomyces variotii]|uniref:ABM domain-containing protein n=1 Tax=Byssochlamys spectabilis TaxID=264951 RepID=A0A443I4C9_BYSSP|nr:hypothetical protein C8Q69DRAFT_502437 [Paecilomyces variotii]KAJ9202995.1 hypothetical protein DTO032I3_3369 [Paecilomyces variotii]KAJ9204939.1 hypothetical protein DTO164E3_1562 [Paecilomyces variotii]KAJ9210705.1 hypothetical protein DTO166G4_7665 [Paecilomyces variotii]KAJ9225618.1 hypothetical protein DTO169C6_2054 [Paecilomyces variotii]KAJ9243095.1 hypothetical protein DTO166G5_199 [Paecilomyces variotii]